MFNFSEINRNPMYLSVMSDLIHALSHISPFVDIPVYNKVMDDKFENDWKSSVLEALEYPFAAKYRDLRLAILYVYMLDERGGLFVIQQAYAKDREKYLKVFKRIRIISVTLMTIGFMLGLTPTILSFIDSSKGFNVFTTLIVVVIATLNIALIINTKPSYFENFEQTLIKANFFAKLIKTNMDIVIAIAKNPAFTGEVEKIDSMVTTECERLNVRKED